MSHVVVTLTGNKGNAKTTLCEHLETYLESKCVTCDVLSFADPLKQAARYLVGIPLEVSYGNDKAKAEWSSYGKTARQHLQWLGTEVGRLGIHKDVWVHRLGDAALSGMKDGIQAILIPDCRFRNELFGLPAYIHERRQDVAFLSVGIDRPGYPLDLSHPSESEPREIIQEHLEREALGQSGIFDEFVVNDGDLEKLHREAERVGDRALAMLGVGV